MVKEDRLSLALLSTSTVHSCGETVQYSRCS